MDIKKTLLVVGGVMMLNGCVVMAHTNGAAVEFDRQLSLDATGLRQLEVEAGAGDLIIKGQPGVDKITVDAHITTAEDGKAGYQLTLKKRGDRAVLVARHDPIIGLWVGNSPSIDLQVLVPPSLMLDISDGPGDIVIRDIQGDSAIRDGSGDLMVRQLTGDLRVEDGSGEIQLNDIAGRVDIDDGSGSMELMGIGGAVNIDDGSGDLKAYQLNNTLIINDGSGDIDIEQVKGHVTIDDGSGDIEVINTGGLSIIDAGSGDLKLQRIQGNVDIDS